MGGHSLCRLELKQPLFLFCRLGGENRRQIKHLGSTFPLDAMDDGELRLLNEGKARSTTRHFPSYLRRYKLNSSPACPTTSSSDSALDSLHLERKNLLEQPADHILRSVPIAGKHQAHHAVISQPQMRHSYLADNTARPEPNRIESRIKATTTHHRAVAYAAPVQIWQTLCSFCHCAKQSMQSKPRTPLPVAHQKHQARMSAS
jgi:hypothetical protein